MKNEFKWKENTTEKHKIHESLSMTESLSRAERFLDLYRSVENVIRVKYHLEKWDSAITFLESHDEFKYLANDLRFCREVRNLLSHNPKVDDAYCVEPSEEMIHFLKKIKERLEKPPVIMDIAVPIGKILYRSFEDNLLETLQAMNDRSFGNVPILENGLVTAVLSEKAIVNYLVQDQAFHLSDKLKLSDLREHLLLENHRKEFYRFVRKDALISDVSRLFHDVLDQGARVGMVFLTQHGRSDEELLGIVTAWDLAGHR